MFLTTRKFKFLDAKNYIGSGLSYMFGTNQWVVDCKS